MRKVLLLLCIFTMFLSFSCSKKSNSDNESGNNSVANESSNKINEGDNSSLNENEDSDDSGLEGFLFDEEGSSSGMDGSLNSDSSFENGSGSSSSFNESGAVENEAEAEKPKDLVPPGAVSKLKGYYNGAKNQISISWQEPGDADFAYVKVLSNGKNQGTVSKGTTTFNVPANSLGNYNISVVTYDNSGNKGPAASFSTEAKFFKSASNEPLAGTAGKGRPFRVVLSGSNFAADGVTPEDFIVTCKEDSSIAKNPKVKIVNDNKVNVDVKIPKKAGKYTINIQCGNNNISGNFTVIDVAPLGTVEKASDGTPVAVLAGYNSLGLPFGVALKEQKGLKWATSFGYSEKFEKIMAIVPQAELGAGSAINATITGDLDGYDNWDAIKAEDGNASNNSYAKDGYPVFHYAATYGDSMPAEYKDGWFIPSLYELCQIYANKAKINEVIGLLGKGTPIGDDFYWSSSQCDEEDDKACAVRFNTGSIFKYKRKSDSIYGRCVRMMY